MQLLRWISRSPFWRVFLDATARPLWSPKVLDEAHRHSSNHQQELKRSELCGCFYCCRTFVPTQIEEWADDECATACCPYCAIDSVIGDASGLPVNDPKFLRAMAARWFS